MEKNDSTKRNTKKKLKAKHLGFNTTIILDFVSLSSVESLYSSQRGNNTL